MAGSAGSRELFVREQANPILTIADWPYQANSVFNCGATQLPDGQTLLLVRVEDRRGHSHFTCARSADGVTNWRIDAEPSLVADPEKYPEELWGVEDPRVVWVGELDRYAVTYAAFGQFGPCVSLALTRDFKSYERYGMVMPPDNKDAAMFPRKLGDRWAMLHRPYPTTPSGGAHIWISYSPDLKHWGDHQVVLQARRGAWWDAGKIGLSPPPIATDEGWLILYHGVRVTAGGCLYRLGAALLDLEDPRRLIRRGDEWIFAPTEAYERVGDVADVVFPCGLVVDQNSGEIRLYYGAADTTIGLARGSIRELLDWLKA